jgi:hypothetical protein
MASVVDIDKIFPLDCDYPDCVQVLSQYVYGGSMHKHGSEFIVIYEDSSGATVKDTVT